MPFCSDLEQADVAEHMGTLFGAGYRGGKLWCRVSIDKGSTDGLFSDGETEKMICSVASRVKPTILSFETRDLQVWFSRQGNMVSYYSQDGGKSWVGGGVA
jgi:hypothetical protein